MEQIWLKWNTDISYEGDYASCQDRNTVCQTWSNTLS